MALHAKVMIALGVSLVPTVLAWSAQPPPATAPVAAPPAGSESNKTPAQGADPAKPKPEGASNDPIARIKDEGLKRSQVMPTLGYLTDVIGPRLTASPALKRANEWTRDTLKGWGLQNTHLEAWGPFGRGWTLKHFSAQVIDPQCIPLIAYPKAWSPGTDGPIVGDVVHLKVEKESDLVTYKGKLKGAVVLLKSQRTLSPRFDPLASRYDDGDLLKLADAPVPSPRRPRRRMATRPRGLLRWPARGPTAPGLAAPAKAQEPPAPRLNEVAELERKKLQFVMDEGAAVLLEPSEQGDGGTLFVAAARLPGQPETMRTAAKRPWEKDAPRMLPQLVVAKEHWNRMIRMIEQREALKMYVDLAVRFHDDDLMGYNTIAEIPGGDLKDEVVMLGGHLDSWHSGTGATDNAVGVAVTMEAVRILQTLQLHPRRTIRIALWTGEEQGLFGSRAYVAEHFGKIGDNSVNAVFGAEGNEAAPPITTKPEADKFSAYFNLDNGTGKIRGVYMQGNEAVRPIFREWLSPFRDMGAATLSIANTGATDFIPFDAIGLPGFQFIQDPIEYGTRTHHSNMDVYDRAVADDLKQAAVIMAAFVYHTAMRDERMPRKALPTSK